MKTRLDAWLRRTVSAIWNFDKIMTVLTVVIVAALIFVINQMWISHRQDEELESRIMPYTEDMTSGQPKAPVREGYRIPNFVPEKKSEEQERADTRVIESPDSDLTRPFVNGDWEAGIAGIKAMIAGIRSRSSGDPYQSMTGTADPVDGNSRWQDVGRGLSWHMAYPLGPYVECEVRVTEYDDITLVEATHTYEYSRAQGEKPRPGGEVRKVRRHEIMLGKPNGKLAFVSADLRTENCRTDESGPEDLDQKAATGHLCQILRFIEEHSKIPPPSSQ